MKNKKADMVFPQINNAIIAIIILLIFIGIIYVFIVSEQIPFIGRQIQHITEDCDEDGSTGLSDDCPCNEDVQKLPTDEKKCPGDIKPDTAKDNCPNLC